MATAVDQAPKPPSEHLFNRACDACRLHKRCLKTDRKCIFTAPQKRKQRKRTDTRVAELEREVLAMRSLFERKKDGLDEETDLVARSNTLNISGETGSAVMLAATSPKNLSTISETSPNSRCSQSFPTPPPDPAASLSQPDWNAPGSNISPDLDVVEKGIVSAETADQLFQTYIKDVCQHYPIVAFPPGTSSESVRRTKPTLFLAVIAASSAITDPHLYSVLHSEAVAAYAHRTVIKSEKSLELVQALAITASWYYPPGKYSKLKFYEYIHMATTMGMDIGIGTNPKASRRRRVASSNQSSPEAAIMKKDEGELERRRTFLSCYLISTGVSMSMRRPNMIRYNSWVHECVAYLDANGNPDCYDNILVNWITLLQICEEIITSFSLDDPSNTVNLAESHVQLMLGGFEKKLLAWREKAESTGLSDTLLVAYYHSQIYLREIAIHDDHPPEHFQPPYRLERAVSIDLDPSASSSYIEPVAIVISSAHSLLDIMLNMDVETLRALPVYNYVRIAYSMVVLTKLYISSKTPASHIGLALDSKTIKLGFYLEAFVEKLSLAVGPMECRAPFTFLGLIMRLQIWYKSQEKDEVFRKPTELYGVLDQCWLPPPPNLKHVQNPITAFSGFPGPLREEDAWNSPLPELDANQIADIESMGIGNLATMQPLPMFDIDFGNQDGNNPMFNWESIDFSTNFQWATDTAMQGVIDGIPKTAVPGTKDWDTEYLNTSFM